MRSVAIRAHPLVFGTVVFLASESMVFAALLAAYYYLARRGGAWPPAGRELDAAGMAVGTALLGVRQRHDGRRAGRARCAAARARARHARADDRRRARVSARWSGATGRSANFRIADDAYATIYYVLTGTHFAHVLAGVVLLAAVAIFLRAPAFTREHHAGVEAVAYYWHFVFVVWLALYATIFLVR